MNVAGIVLSPITAGPKGLFWVFRKIQEEAEREQNDPVRLRGKLMELQRRAAAGEIGDEQYELAEEVLLARLDRIEELAEAARSADRRAASVGTPGVGRRRARRASRRRAPTYPHVPPTSVTDRGGEVR